MDYTIRPFSPHASAVSSKKASFELLFQDTTFSNIPASSRTNVDLNMSLKSNEELINGSRASSRQDHLHAVKQQNKPTIGYGGPAWNNAEGTAAALRRWETVEAKVSSPRTERPSKAKDYLTTTPIFNDGEENAGKKTKSLLATFQKEDRDMFEAPYVGERRTVEAKPIIVMTIEIDEERNDDIRVYEGDEPRRLAIEFCARNGLDLSIVDSLASSIAEQVAGYRRKVDEKRRKAPTVSNRENVRQEIAKKHEEPRHLMEEPREVGRTPEEERKGTLHERLYKESKVLQQRRQELARKEAENKTKEVAGMFKPTLATQRRVTPPNGRPPSQNEDVGEQTKRRKAEAEAKARKTPSPNTWRRPGELLQGQTPPSTRGFATKSKSPTGGGSTFTRLYQDAKAKQLKKEKVVETSGRTSPMPTRGGANTSRSRERKAVEKPADESYSFHPRINKNSVYYRRLKEREDKGLSSDEDDVREDYEVRHDRKTEATEVRMRRTPSGLNLKSNVRTTRSRDKTAAKRAESKSPKHVVVGFVAGRRDDEERRVPSGLYKGVADKGNAVGLKPRELNIVNGVFALLDSDGDGFITAHTVDLSRLNVEVLEILTDVLCELEDRGVFLNREGFYKALVEKGKLGELLDAGAAFLQVSTANSTNASYQYGRPTAERQANNASTSFVETRTYLLGASSGRGLIS